MCPPWRPMRPRPPNQPRPWRTRRTGGIRAHAGTVTGSGLCTAASSAVLPRTAQAPTDAAYVQGQGTGSRSCAPTAWCKIRSHTRRRRRWSPTGICAPPRRRAPATAGHPGLCGVQRPRRVWRGCRWMVLVAPRPRPRPQPRSRPRHWPRRPPGRRCRSLSAGFVVRGAVPTAAASVARQRTPRTGSAANGDRTASCPGWRCARNAAPRPRPPRPGTQ